MAIASALVFVAVEMTLLAVTPTKYVSSIEPDGTVNGALTFSNTPQLRPTETPDARLTCRRTWRFRREYQREEFSYARKDEAGGRNLEGGIGRRKRFPTTNSSLGGAGERAG